MVLLVASILCGGICLGVSDVKRDEVIVFFPSLARRIAGGTGGRHELSADRP
jgi:hypothetical protein